eukprot:9466562-Pyramimonas_sp.AAC.1
MALLGRGPVWRGGGGGASGALQAFPRGHVGDLGEVREADSGVAPEGIAPARSQSDCGDVLSVGQWPTRAHFNSNILVVPSNELRGAHGAKLYYRKRPTRRFQRSPDRGPARFQDATGGRGRAR